MGSPTGGASKSDSGSHDKLRLGADLRALLGVDFIAEDDLIAALEAAGAFIRPKGSGAQPRVLPAASPPFPAASPLPSLRLARPAAQLWALAKVASASPPSDPWDAHKLWERPTELCIRHDYDPRRRVWTASDTLAKMEDVPFGKGAMRECFRLKKMSQFNPAFFYNMDWRHCANYVAKRYIAPGVGRDVYLADVQMQAEAKLWAARYNRLHPPKHVDFLTAFALEFPHRGGQLFGVERLIDGPYQKYNGNSGYVGADHRTTPHTFSLFTFCASRARLMVVDIQGVGDMFTDPQVHTADGQGYGDGNLGVHGMALFLATFEHNQLCKDLRLPPFPIAPSEERRAKATHMLGASAVAANVAANGGGSQTASERALLAAMAACEGSAPPAGSAAGSSAASSALAFGGAGTRALTHLLGASLPDSPCAGAPSGGGSGGCESAGEAAAPGSGSGGCAGAGVGSGATLSARLNLLLDRLVSSQAASLSRGAAQGGEAAPAAAGGSEGGGETAASGGRSASSGTGAGAAAAAGGGSGRLTVDQAAVDALPWAVLADAIARLARGAARQAAGGAAVDGGGGGDGSEMAARAHEEGAPAAAALRAAAATPAELALSPAVRAEGGQAASDAADAAVADAAEAMAAAGALRLPAPIVRARTGERGGAQEAEPRAFEPAAAIGGLRRARLDSALSSRTDRTDFTDVDTEIAADEARGGFGADGGADGVAPSEEEQAAHEQRVHAQIHTTLAKMNYTGTLPGQAPERPDIAAALFHLCHAAACGSVEATRELLALCRGLPSLQLPQVTFAREQPAKARALLELAAWQGDRFACLELADADLARAAAQPPARAAEAAPAAAGAGGVGSAIVERYGEEAATDAARWLQHALACAEGSGAWTDEDDAEAEQAGAADFQLCAKLGEALEACARWEDAAAAYERAADGAMARSKGKLSFKLSEKAEAARANAPGGDE